MIECLSLQTSGNPYDGATFYLDPDYVDHLTRSQELVAEQDELVATIELIKQQPTAVWLDTPDMLEKGDVATGRRSLNEHLKIATRRQNNGKQIQPIAIQMVAVQHPISGVGNAYPTELGYTTDDLGRYKTGYIDKIKMLAEAYPNIRFILVLEPNTVPDLLMAPEFPTTCGASLHCQRVRDANELVQYAVDTLGKAASRNVYIYLGIGHSAWLTTGVEYIPSRLAKLFPNLSTVKGFATNTAAYTPFSEEMVIYKEAGDRIYIEEKALVERLDKILKEEIPTSTFGFITDTSRNGWGGPGRPTVAGGTDRKSVV